MRKIAVIILSISLLIGQYPCTAHSSNQIEFAYGLVSLEIPETKTLKRVTVLGSNVEIYATEDGELIIQVGYAGDVLFDLTVKANQDYIARKFINIDDAGEIEYHQIEEYDIERIFCENDTYYSTYQKITSDDGLNYGITVIGNKTSVERDALEEILDSIQVDSSLEEKIMNFEQCGLEDGYYVSIHNGLRIKVSSDWKPKVNELLDEVVFSFVNDSANGSFTLKRSIFAAFAEIESDVYGGVFTERDEVLDHEMPNMDSDCTLYYCERKDNDDDIAEAVFAFIYENYGYYGSAEIENSSSIDQKEILEMLLSIQPNVT